jgi:hypothetical protein
MLISAGIAFSFLPCLEDLLRQILVEERRQLAEVLPGLGRIGIAGILRVRLAFEHVKIGDNAGLTRERK